MKAFFRKSRRCLSAISDEKKCIICLALTIIMGLLLIYTYIDEQETDYEGIIRLHVIANSDSTADQALKLKVRDAIIEYMNKQDDLADTDAMRDYLQNDLDRFCRISAGVIASEGCDYPVTADLGVRYIPEKTYGDITFPAGNYEALNITIGNGQGENWWCVLFPPLCLLDEGTEALEDESAAAGGTSGYSENAADGKASDGSGDALSEDSMQQLQLRWKLLELLQEK